MELSAAELASLREAGLEPRAGVLGLYLLRDRWHDDPIVPKSPIELDGELKSKAEAMRDELASQLREKGTEGLPLHSRSERPDLRGVWLPRANLREAQLQKANLSKAQLKGAYLRKAQLEGANLR